MRGKESPKVIFGNINGIVKIDVAVKLNFNSDICSGYVARSFPIPEGGNIYHSKSSGGINIVVAEVYPRRKGESMSFYLRTFEGPEPMEMEDLDEGKASELSEKWREQVMGVVSPEFKVTPKELRKKLEELSKNQ